MKVLSKPDYTTWKYEFTCYTCASKLCADYTDLKYRIEKKWRSDAYGDGGDYCPTDHYYIVCSVCNKETEINYTKIPYLLQEKIKKEYK